MVTNVYLYRDRRTGIWYAGYSSAAGPVRWSLRTKVKGVADQLRARLVADLVADRLGRPLPRLLSAAIAEYLGSRTTINHETRLHYATKLALLQSELPAEAMVSDVTTDLLAGLRAKRGQDHARGTVRGDMVAIGMFLDWCVERRYIAPSPMTRAIKRVRGVEHDARIALSEAEVATYLAALGGTHLWPVMMLGVFAGLRRREICAADAEDVREGILLVRRKPEIGFTPKSHEARPVPIEPELAAVLPLLPREGPLCLPAWGERWRPDTLSHAWTEAVARLRLRPRVTLHVLRHTYASTQIQSRGTDVFSLMRRLGHASLSTVQIYFHEFQR